MARFVAFVKATKESEAGQMPTEEQLAEMATFNEQLVKAGVMLDGSGLRPTSDGVRIQYGAGKPIVIDGPFAETKELIAGYWLLQCATRDEAVEWLKRVPFAEGEIELRQLFELEDFGSSPAIEHHRKIADQISKK